MCASRPVPCEGLGWGGVIRAATARVVTRVGALGLRNFHSRRRFKLSGPYKALGALPNLKNRFASLSLTRKPERYNFAPPVSTGLDRPRAPSARTFRIITRDQLSGRLRLELDSAAKRTSLTEAHSRRRGAHLQNRLLAALQRHQARYLSLIEVPPLSRQCGKGGPTRAQRFD